MYSTPLKKKKLWKEKFLQIHYYFADEIFTRGWQKLWVIVTAPGRDRGNDALSDNLEETPRVCGGSASGERDQKVEDPVSAKNMKEVVKGWAVHHEETLKHKVRDATIITMMIVPS